MWEPTPSSVTPRGSDTVVAFRFRNGRSRELALRTPHTFRLDTGIVVSNRYPDEAVADRGTIVGTWIVPAMRWRPTPTSVVRRDYNTLVVTFEADERRGTPINAARMRDVRHTCTVEGVTVSDRKPDRADTERGGRTCPCYGTWIVNKPLPQPAWSATPTRPPRRTAGRVVVEYEFFAPGGGPQAWDAVARDTPHTIPAGRTSVVRRPDAVDVTNTGRILGRWTLPAASLEAYGGLEDSGGCPLRPYMYWILVILLLSVALWMASRNQR